MLSFDPKFFKAAVRSSLDKIWLSATTPKYTLPQRLVLFAINSALLDLDFVLQSCKINLLDFKNVVFGKTELSIDGPH